MQRKDNILYTAIILGLYVYMLTRTLSDYLERATLEEIFNISECYAWSKHVNDVQIEVIKLLFKA